MGLFDKTNPSATRASVTGWAIAGAIGGPILLSVHFWLKGWRWPEGYWLPSAIAAAIVGAGLFALMEWQLDDGDEEDKKPDPDRPAGVWDGELDGVSSYVTGDVP